MKIATTALQTCNTVQQQYNLYRQMMNSPNTLYQRFLSPRCDLLLMQQVSNTYGNSMGWLNASNTGMGASASNQQAVVPRTGRYIAAAKPALHDELLSFDNRESECHKISIGEIKAKVFHILTICSLRYWGIPQFGICSPY
ncbi:MAG: hypothetical protein WAN35_03645 [Terracidiphilus sp.]